MKRKIMRTILRQMLPVLMAGVLAACETVQTTQGGAVGVSRQQRMAVSSTEVEQASNQQYSELIAEARRKGVLNKDPAQVSRVRAIANRLIPQTTAFRPDARRWDWEINVLSTPEVNAWCMPGGKIAVYTGLLDKLHPTDDELAAVLGHEIAHALREHARERISEQAVAGSIISVGAALLGLSDTAQKGAEALYMGAMGLPHSRQQETEADRIGVELEARAGYDPRAAITLWQKMGQLGGSEPLPFLSTHPSREDRMADLSAYSQRVLPLYEQAKKSR